MNFEEDYNCQSMLLNSEVNYKMQERAKDFFAFKSNIRDFWSNCVDSLRG